MHSRRIFAQTIAAAALLSVAFTGAAFAQDKFPSKDITFVVQAAAGGASDRTSRAIAAELEKDLGVSVIVENRPGATGTVAFAHVAEQPADGYTIGFGPVEFAIVEHLGYDFDRKDYTYLAQVMNSPVVLAVPANSPYNTLAEFIEAGQDQGALGLQLGCGILVCGDCLHPLQDDRRQAHPGAVRRWRTGRGCRPGQPRRCRDCGRRRNRQPPLPTGRSRSWRSSPTRSIRASRASRPPRSRVIDLTFGAWGGVYGPAGIPDDAKAILEKLIKKAAASQTFLDAITPAGILPAYKTGAEWEAFIETEAARYAEVLK